jgi:hypothetical protein
MPDDIRQKQEKPFLNHEQELKKEDFKAKLEIPSIPEQHETFEKKEAEDIDKEKEAEKEGELGQGSIASISTQKQDQDEREKKIEKILEKDMDDVYLGLRSEKREEFKTAGEKTAKQINGMINNGKLKFKKVIALIKKWLLVVPGINRFFLEQEAKLKTDEIMKITEK